jgi:alpha-tubulin suppressor-like RCC1 family protein
MHACRWLIILPLFLLAAASGPSPAAQHFKTNQDRCADAGHSLVSCAGAVAVALPATPAVVTALWGGARESIALKSDGTVWTWGVNNCLLGSSACGKLGDGTTIERLVPVEVHGPGNIGYLGSVTAIMGGEHHNFALKSDGTVWAWGGNFVGQLGIGNFTNTTVPVQVSFPVSVTMLGGRGYHSLAVDMNGTVWAWGWNSQGQLGHDTSGNPCPTGFTPCSNVPVQVLGISHPLTVTGGGFFSLAVMPDHTVMGWGSNSRGQLGDGSYSNRSSPVAVSGVLSHVVALSAGWKHAVALTDDGHVWAWGDNFEGEIGLGITTTLGITIPTQVPGLSGVVSVSAGDRFTGALKGDGTVWTWGANQFLQLGNNSNVADSPVPVKVLGLDHVKLYAARDYHNLAVRDDETVWAWGSGENGELGDNLTASSGVPVRVLFDQALLPPRLWLPLAQR